MGDVLPHPSSHCSRRAALRPFAEKEEGALEASVHVTCPRARPAPSLTLRPTWSSSPGLIKPGHGEGAELQTRVQRSWGRVGGGSATSGKALAAAVQILGPRGREIQEE